MDIKVSTTCLHFEMNIWNSSGESVDVVVFLVCIYLWWVCLVLIYSNCETQYTCTIYPLHKLWV